MGHPVAVSGGCCDKSAQAWELKTTEIYSLTVLEARSLAPGWAMLSRGLKGAIDPRTGSLVDRDWSRVCVRAVRRQGNESLVISASAAGGGLCRERMGGWLMSSCGQLSSRDSTCCPRPSFKQWLEGVCVWPQSPFSEPLSPTVESSSG